MIYWKPKRILEWTLVIHSFFCCWLHSQRSKPGISLAALTTCNAVSRSCLQDHSKLAHQHWFFSTAPCTASSPAGMAPSTAPHLSILVPCLFLKIPVENVLSPLLTTESKCVNSWSPHLNLFFSLTPLWSHMDYSIKQLSLLSLNVCNFSFSQCQRFGFNPILPCTLSISLFIVLISHTRFTYSFGRGTKSSASSVFPRNQRQCQLHSSCLINTCYLIVAFPLACQNDGYTIRRLSVIIFWTISCSAIHI